MPNLITCEQIPDPKLREILDGFFKAKPILYANAPEFAMVDAGPLKCLHAVPGWPEIDHFYAFDVEPEDAIRAIESYGPHPNHWLTVFTPSPDAVIARYKRVRYSPLPSEWTQPLMHKRLAIADAAEGPARVRHVETEADLHILNTGHPTIVTAKLNDAHIKYFIEADGKIVSWGRCVITSPGTVYICGMETLSEYRRRGFTKAILNSMHRDASALGARESILCASPMGYPLYQASGYTTVLFMQTLIPTNRVLI